MYVYDVRMMSLLTRSTGATALHTIIAHSVETGAIRARRLILAYTYAK